MRVKSGLMVIGEVTRVDIDDVFDVKDIPAWVARFYSPIEVFSDTELRAWAYDEGLVEEKVE